MGTRKSHSYSERIDIEKIQSNWKKTLGLFSREEWSGAIVRAATVTEIAANLVVRKELQEGKGLSRDFVDSLLLWANGLHGKFHRLILPVCKDENPNRHKIFKTLASEIGEINRHRNRIVHSGQFKNPRTAMQILEKAKKVVETLVGEYRKDFSLLDIPKTVDDGLRKSKLP